MATALKVLKAGPVALTLKPYTSFPKNGYGAVPADYEVSINGTRIDQDKLARTGGGTAPAYLYIKLGDEIYYLEGAFTSGINFESDDFPKADTGKAPKAPRKGKK